MKLKWKRTLTFILTVTMVFTMVPTFAFTAFAANVNDKLFVNGTQIADLTKDETIQCGDGTAVYTAADQTLTLNDATIFVPYNANEKNIGIHSKGSVDINIVLNGTNTIGTENKPMLFGIYSVGEVNISGSGSLNIVTETHWKFIPEGIVALHGFSARDVSINIRGLDDNSAQANDRGIGVQEDDAFFTCDNATITVSGYKRAFDLWTDSEVVISDSTITATDSLMGIVNGSEDLKIINSTVDIKANKEDKKEDALGISTWGDLFIDHSNVTAVSSESHAIWSGGSAHITNGSDLELIAQGTGVALGGEAGVAISDSSIDAASSNSIAIISEGTLDISGSTVYAKGATGKAAIAARVLKTGNEAAEPKISLTNEIEKNGGKVAFCDWVTVNNRAVSWSTFIDKSETALTVDADGGMTNALNEVWLAAPYTVTFDADGTTSEVTVYPSNTVTAPTDPAKDGCHFSGWYLGDTKFDFTDTAITGDMTLKAKLDAHTPNTDDGDCTTAITCSVCSAVTTAEKAHVISPNVQFDSTDHWNTCSNADCDHIERKAEHIPSAATIEHAQVCTVCGYELAPKLQAVIVDNTTGVKAEYEDGTPFDADIVLGVTSMPQTEMDKWGDAVNKVAPGFTLGGLYDISLLKNGMEIQPNGKIKVSIPLTDAMKSMTDLQVIYIDDDGKVTIIPSEVKDGKIVFVTDHFSYYGVIGKVKATDPSNPPTNPEPITPPKDSPQTGDSSPILPLGLLALASGTALVILVKKRKVLGRVKK